MLGGRVWVLLGLPWGWGDPHLPLTPSSLADGVVLVDPDYLKDRKGEGQGEDGGGSHTPRGCLGPPQMPGSHGHPPPPPPTPQCL